VNATPPSLTVTSVTIGAPDPRALAAFYARLLSTEVAVTEPARPGKPPEDGWAQLRPAGAPSLNFEYETVYEQPVWPSRAGEQQIMEHLDIKVDDLDAATAWAIDCGAKLADFQPQESVRVLYDPAGHPFCLYV
jgi:catechol 2,3-dioxygenase-like lactoylglutathione lyase family enzyme